MLPQCMLQKALAFPTPSLLFGSGPSAKRVTLNPATHMGDHLHRQIIENQQSDFRDTAPDMSVSAGAEGSGNEGDPTYEEGKKKKDDLIADVDASKGRGPWQAHPESTGRDRRPGSSVGRTKPATPRASI